jgi:type IV secretion system protein TrbL
MRAHSTRRSAAGLLRFAVVSALGLTVLRGALLAGDALAGHVLDGAANTFAFAMRGALTRDQDRLFLALLFLRRVASIAPMAYG